MINILQYIYIYLPLYTFDWGLLVAEDQFKQVMITLNLDMWAMSEDEEEEEKFMIGWLDIWQSFKLCSTVSPQY